MRPVYFALLTGALVLAGFFTATYPLTPQLAATSVVAIILLAVPSFTALIRWQGWQRGTLIILALGLYAFAFESLAILTGVPYGSFQYGALIGLRIGVVPWTVLLAWSPLLLGAFALVGQFRLRVWQLLLLVPVVLTVVDLVLDPAAVSLGFWSWDAPGVYYGVPLVNYVGWLLSGLVGAALLWLLLGKMNSVPRALGWSATCSLIFWTSVCAWRGLVFPALLGVALSLVFAWLVTSGTQRR